RRRRRRRAAARVQRTHDAWELVPRGAVMRWTALFAALAALAAMAARAEPPGSEAWLARAQREIAEREYRASENGSGLQAPNRAHDLRTYFERTGIRVHDRTAAGSPELLALSLAGIGRGAELAPVAPGELAPDGERVEIRRPCLVEWYVNSAAGLEQGFTI